MQSQRLKVFILSILVLFLCQQELFSLSYSKVIGINPSRAEENVSVNKIIALTFNNKIHEETLNVNSITVMDQSGNNVKGYIFYDKQAKRCFFKPKELLKYNTEYTIIVTAYLIKDINNNPLIDDVVSTFRTALEVNKKYITRGDRTQPKIIKLSPGTEVQEVPVDSSIYITFSENIKPSTLNPYTVVLEDDLGTLSGKYFYSQKYFRLKFMPIEKLKRDTKYKVTITDGITDIAGNYLENPMSYVFFTEKPEDTEPPFVVNSSPIADAENVRITSNIMLTFSEKLDPETINSNSFYIMENGHKVLGRTDYNDNLNKILFTPAKNLKYGTTYDLYITKKLTDAHSNPFKDIYVLKFTIEPSPDRTPPEVVSVFPEGGAKNVKINTKIVVNFSETLRKMTVNNFTLFLKNEKGNIPTIMSFGAKNKKVILTPIKNLEYGIRYDLKITSGIKDKSGNSLIKEYNGQFITEPAPDKQGPKVIAVNPEDHAEKVNIRPRISIEFNELVNSKTIDGTSIKLLDKKRNIIPCTFNTYEKKIKKVIFIPNKELEYEKEYTIVLDRSIEDIVGNQMPNMEKFVFYTMPLPDKEPPTVVYISPVNDSEKVEITAQIGAAFSEDMQPVTINEFSVVLSDGRKDVKGRVSYDKLTRKVMFIPERMLEYSKTYIFTIKSTVRDMSGNQLEKDVASRFTIEKQPDRTPPKVVYISPKNNSKDIPVDITLKAKFSEKLLDISVNEFNVILHKEGKHIEGMLKYDKDKNIVSFKPDRPLEYNTLYNFVLSKEIFDLSENKLEKAVKISFKTAEEPDTFRPFVTNIEPSQNSNNISIFPKIKIDISEPIKKITLNKFTINLKNNKDENISFKMDIKKNLKTIILKPIGKLDYNSNYKVIVSRMIQDKAGNCPLSTFVSTFKTQRKPDNTPPKIVSITPKLRKENVDVGSKIKIEFSEPLDDRTINRSTVYIQKAGKSNIISSTVSLSKLLDTITIIPDTRFEYSTDYRVVVSTSVKDIAGNELEEIYTSGFKTKNVPDTINPRIISFTPHDMSGSVPINCKIVVRFSEKINNKTISDKNIKISTGFRNIRVITSFSPKTNTLVLIPGETLSYLTKYKVMLSGKISDMSGNQLERAYISSFMTEEPPDTIKPMVISYEPKNESVVKPENVHIRVSFSEKINDSTLNKYTFMVHDKNKNFVPGVIKYNKEDNIAEFISTTEIPYGEKYIVTLTEGIQDIAGNPIKQELKYSFSIGRIVDNTKPIIVMTVPSDNEKDVSITSSIIASFSKRMSMRTLNKYTIIVSDGTKTVSGKIDYSDRLRQVSFTPNKPMKAGKIYQVTLTDGITDISGNTVEKSKSWMFKTVSYK